jgi:hypothetical protein
MPNLMTMAVQEFVREKGQPMKPLLRGIVVMTFLLVSGTSSAQVSFGGSDCVQWLNIPRDVRNAWLLGFLVGLNAGWIAWSKTPGDPLANLNSTEHAFRWMDNYCRANPARSANAGAIALFNELAKAK